MMKAPPLAVLVVLASLGFGVPLAHPQEADSTLGCLLQVTWTSFLLSQHILLLLYVNKNFSQFCSPIKPVP